MPKRPKSIIVLTAGTALIILGIGSSFISSWAHSLEGQWWTGTLGFWAMMIAIMLSVSGVIAIIFQAGVFMAAMQEGDDE